MGGGRCASAGVAGWPAAIAAGREAAGDALWAGGGCPWLLLAAGRVLDSLTNAVLASSALNRPAIRLSLLSDWTRLIVLVHDTHPGSPRPATPATRTKADAA
jgi:hypothetical protein